MLIVRRSKPTSNFTIIPNELLRDDRLTFCARGVLMELLSRPPGWETSADAISDRARKHRGDVVGEGRRAMRAVFKELEVAGYMIRRIENRPGGNKKGGQYISVLEVYDVPQCRSDGRTGGGMSVSGTSVNGTAVTGTSSVSTDGRSTEEEDSGEEHSSALAGARAGEEARANDLPPELTDLYAAANKLDDDRLRRLLLQFEVKRPSKHREKRYEAREQLKREDPAVLRGARSVRTLDLLTFKYALQHYYDIDKPALGIPAWLRRFPR